MGCNPSSDSRFPCSPGVRRGCIGRLDLRLDRFSAAVVRPLHMSLSQGFHPRDRNRGESKETVMSSLKESAINVLL